MTMKFKITNVDMDGFNGREHHPHRSDIGLVVTVLSSQLWNLDSEGDEGEVTPEMLKMRSDLLADPDTLFTFYTCVTDDGRILDMIDFELEPVSR